MIQILKIVKKISEVFHKKKVEIELQGRKESESDEH